MKFRLILSYFKKQTCTDSCSYCGRAEKPGDKKADIFMKTGFLQKLKREKSCFSQ